MESLRVSVISRFTAVAAAGGNDAITAGLSAGSGELAAPMIAKWMFGTDKAEKLTAEQKSTVSNITGLIGTGAGATTGNVTDAVASGRASENAVDNNYLTVHDLTNFAKEMGQCTTQECLRDKVSKYQEISDENLEEAKAFCAQNPDQCSEKYAEILSTISEANKDKYYEALGIALEQNTSLSKSEKAKFARYADTALRNAWITGYGEQTDVLVSKFADAIKLTSQLSDDNEEQAAAMLGGVLLGMPKTKNTGTRPPKTSRADTKSVYGEDSVTSTTVVDNPRQRVTSSSSKGVEVMTDSYGNKAVKVTYADPLTGETKVANIAYDSNSMGRGLPIFDDYAKFTTNITKPKGWRNMTKKQRTEKEMQNATKELHHYLEANPQMKAQFTAKQLKQIAQGKARIEDYTWHHNAQSGPNNMQLVPRKIHDEIRHIGEASLSEGK